MQVVGAVCFCREDVTTMEGLVTRVANKGFRSAKQKEKTAISFAVYCSKIVGEVVRSVWQAMALQMRQSTSSSWRVKHLGKWTIHHHTHTHFGLAKRKGASASLIRQSASGKE